MNQPTVFPSRAQLVHPLSAATCGDLLRRRWTRVASGTGWTPTARLGIALAALRDWLSQRLGMPGYERSGLGLILLGCALLAGCCPRSNQTLSGLPLVRCEFEAVEMAIPFRIVAYAPNWFVASNAAHAAFARISDLNRSLSDYDAESELSHLSLTAGSGIAIPLSADLATVLLRARDFSAASGGAFDVTVGPLTQLWRRARRQHELPDPERLTQALEAVGWTNLILTRTLADADLSSRRSPSTVALSYTARLNKPKMRLDLGAIAKGYALDEAARVLRQHGLTRTLVTGAGDMVAGDPPPGESGWKIDLAPLDLADAPPGLSVRLKNGSLCTSGDLFQHVEIGGVRYSHIVDPHTGLGMTDHSLVIAIGPDGITTDALSTTLSVVGPERGLPIARQFRSEARIIRAPGGQIEISATRGFPRPSR